MGLIWKIILGMITIFEKITGIDVTDFTDDTTEAEEVKCVEIKSSPLEVELQGIKPGAYGRCKKIAKYMISFYNKPYADLGGLSIMSSASIKTIVSKYLDNELLFSEQYEDHVIDLTGKVETIGKEGENVYISIGDGELYYRNGTSSKGVKQLIKCYLDKSDMEDDNYKELVLNMRPGMEVTLVGVLRKERYNGYAMGGFELYGTTLIEVEGIVPDGIMDIIVDMICQKYETED